MARRGKRKTDITLWDHIKLRRELASRPHFVLAHFKRCHVDNLMEVRAFREILIEMPAVAVRIALVASGMGIPIGDEGLPL
jgi:hypothetical protein